MAPLPCLSTSPPGGLAPACGPAPFGYTPDAELDRWLAHVAAGGRLYPNIIGDAEIDDAILREAHRALSLYDDDAAKVEAESEGALTVERQQRIGLLSRALEATIDEGLLASNPCRKVRWKRGETTSWRERVLTQDEEARLFAELEGSADVRDAAELALNTGLRKMTILRMNVEQFDRGGRTFRFTGKGGREHVLPLNSAAWAVIERRMVEPAPGGYLFRNRTGHCLSSATGAFHLAVVRAKIDDLRFHDLRHTFATRLRAHTADPYTVRDSLTHANLATTDIYTNADLASVREAVEGLARERPSLKLVRSA